MISHLIKINWNRKKRNFLMVLGIGISFFALFIATTSAGYTVINAMKPLGFNWENVWYLKADWKDTDTTEVRLKLSRLEEILTSTPEIREWSYSCSYLFMPSATSITELHNDHHRSRVIVLSAGQRFDQVLDTELIQGSWFSDSGVDQVKIPIVVNQKLVNAFFPDGQVIGQTLISESDQEYEIIGVVGCFRNGGEFSGDHLITFQEIGLDKPRSFRRLTHDPMFNRILLKMSPEADMNFEEQFISRLNQLAPDWVFQISSLAKARQSARNQSLIIPAILVIVCGFLVINVALGLFGIIWYNTHLRRAELGLRRAVGATTGGILFQIIGETLIMVTFGVIIGGIFAIQIPLMNLLPFIEYTVYAAAAGSAMIIIYLMALVCSVYPGYSASLIQPAAALHEE